MKTVFISAVSSEYGAHRTRLATELRRKGVKVVVQDDFRQGPGKLLDKIRTQIDQCDAVICLIGNEYGSAPPGTGGRARSYTQCEFDFALRRHINDKMPLFVYMADTPELGEDATEEDRIQRRFIEEVVALGLDRDPIESEDKLVIRVLYLDWGDGQRVAWKPMLAIGAVILLAALLIAGYAYQQDWFAHERLNRATEQRIEAKVTELLSKPPEVIDTPAVDRVDIDTLPIAENKGFTTLRKDLVWDLRRHRHVKVNAIGEAGSAINLMATMQVRKNEPADTFVTAPKTHGTELYSRVATDFPSKSYALAIPRLVGESGMLERQNHYDVSRIEIGEEFLIRERRTYWNSMQVASDNWVGIIARGELRESSILVLFPEDRPFTNYWVTAAVNGNEIRISPTNYDEDNYFIFSDENGRWLYLEILQPESGYVYQVRWEW
jgi:hypothetical protein